ncbi:MAG: hypothetical protein ABIR15_09700 [Chitinophagaceae bacterium]
MKEVAPVIYGSGYRYRYFLLFGYIGLLTGNEYKKSNIMRKARDAFCIPGIYSFFI